MSCRDSHEMLVAYLEKLIEKDRELKVVLGMEWEDRVAGASELFELRQVGAGEPIVSQGEERDCIYLLLEGGAAVEQHYVPSTMADKSMSEEELHVVEKVEEVVRLEPPDVIGEVAVVLAGQRTATVTASEETTMLSIGIHDLNGLMVADSRLCAALLMWMAQNTVVKLKRTSADIPDAYWAVPHESPKAEKASLFSFLKGARGRKYLTPHVIKEKLHRKPQKLLKKQLKTLSRVRWLGVPAPVTDSFAADFEVSSASKGSYIIDNKGKDTNILMLMRGAASLRDASGETIHTFGGIESGEESGEGFLMGEMAFLQPGAERWGAIVADQDCTMLELGRHQLTKMLSRPGPAPGYIVPETRFAIHLLQSILRTVCFRLMEATEQKAEGLGIPQGDYALWFSHHHEEE